MSASLKLRDQIETTLAGKIPHAFAPVQRVIHHLTASGIDTVDEILQGGLPCSAITELVGSQCSGRTSIALAYVAAVTKTSGVCAWIDVADALDPESAAANGVDLERLLWVRCGPPQRVSFTFSGETTQSPAILAVLEPRHKSSGSSSHPRSESQGMPQAIRTLLQSEDRVKDGQLRREKKSIGTPGMPNRPLSWRSEHREEQVNSDRLPPRRGDNLAPPFAAAPHCAEPQPRRITGLHAGKSLIVERIGESGSLKMETSALGKSWQALDQALRTTDLLLQGGGFSVIVLDLGSLPADAVWRIPLATWFRFRVACKRTRISLLLLTQHPCARSSAALVVRLETGSIVADSKVMAGVRYSAAAERSLNHESERSLAHEKDAGVVPIRKGPQSERSTSRRPGQWMSQAAWVHAR